MPAPVSTKIRSCAPKRISDYYRFAHTRGSTRYPGCMRWESVLVFQPGDLILLEALVALEQRGAVLFENSVHVPLLIVAELQLLGKVLVDPPATGRSDLKATMHSRGIVAIHLGGNVGRARETAQLSAAHAALSAAHAAFSAAHAARKAAAARSSAVMQGHRRPRHGEHNQKSERQRRLQKQAIWPHEHLDARKH